MKYYIWILGCAMNYSDAERLSATLDSLGFSKTLDEKECDIFIVVSCSVRQSAINRIYGKVRDLKKYGKSKKLTTILTGCVLEGDRKKLSETFDILFEIKDLEKLPQLLANTLPSSVIPTEAEGSLDKLRDDKLLSGEYLSIVPHYESAFRAYVPIMTGCNNFCTYCAVPYTRGREKSRQSNEIINEVRQLIEKGYKEITLLGQNVNSYGQDLSPIILCETKDQDSSTSSQIDTKSSNDSFVRLLLEIDKIPGDYRIYFYSNHPKDFSETLIDTLPKLKHFPHYVHLPLQSGNDEIIRKMNRNYTKEQYLGLVNKIKVSLPDVAITTDIIVGFPTESEEQFKDTVEVMETVGYDMAFIAQYSERSGTLAAKKYKDDVTDEEKIKRENVLQRILAKTAKANNEKLVDTIQKVLVDGVKNGKFYGRTEGYKVVEIVKLDRPEKAIRVEGSKTDNDHDLIGKFLKVKITSTTPWKLIGQVDSN